MQFDHVAVTLRLVLPATKPLAPVPISASTLGERLAVVVDEYVREQQLGYYPPLDYFEDIEEIDHSLLDAARQMAWQGSKLAREKIENNLKPVFSTVRFQSIQTTAYNMPAVRPAQEDAVRLLGEHFTPDTLRVDLVVSMVRRENDNRRDGAEMYARKMMFRWLSEAFDDIKITASAIETG